MSTILNARYLARFAACCTALAALPAFAAQADQFPTKPIRVVVGPGTDLLPRAVGEKLTAMWGQQVVIDQRPGGGGTIAQDIASKSGPDGYTWLISTAAFAINTTLYPKQSSNLLKDFAPVTLLATATFYLLVHPSVPAKSVGDLIRLAKEQPGKLNYASSGIGTPPHLAGEMFKSMARVNIVHVPYKSAAAAVTDLLGGHVQISFQYAPAALPHVKSGKLRPLAVTSAKRSLTAPDLPTVAESGLPGFEVIGWNGVHVRAGTPKAVIAKINRDAREVLKSKDIQERMLTAGLELAGLSTEGFAAFVNRDVPHWAKLIKESGAHVD